MVIESRYPGKRLLSLFLPLFILLVFILFPFYWTFITSVKPESELYGAVTYWPHSVTFVAYQKLFTTTVNFFVAMKNSLIAVYDSRVARGIDIGRIRVFALSVYRQKIADEHVFVQQYVSDRPFAYSSVFDHA